MMSADAKITDCFIMGAKSIGNYGGFETFLEKLLEGLSDDPEIRLHFTCKKNGEGARDPETLPGMKKTGTDRFTYLNAEGLLVRVPEFLGAAQAVWYDLRSLGKIVREIQKNRSEHPVVCILTCRIGPFAQRLFKKIKKLGGTILLNPDGHEWMRGKWSGPVRRYWKLSEHLMVKAADLVICDSRLIEKYIQSTYAAYSPKTEFIAYGAEIFDASGKTESGGVDEKFEAWKRKNGLNQKFYYVCGRMVPENNIGPILREFMKSGTEKMLAVITTENPKLLETLEDELHFRSDPRIRFTGPVYDRELLLKIRHEAFGYIHGHSVGGTNPSLLEALGAGGFCFLYDVGFNREPAENAALYWTAETGSLSALLDGADQMTPDMTDKYREAAVRRIRGEYSWEKICGDYRRVIIGNTPVKNT